MAQIDKLLRDLSIIAKLSDYPGSQDGLSTDEFKAKFDEAGLAIQEYLNTVLIPAVEAISPESGPLPLSGGTMTGDINMNGNRVTNVPTPLGDADAVPKRYAVCIDGDSMKGALKVMDPVANEDAATKGYVDRKHLFGTVTLVASAWNSGEQTVEVEGILNTDMPHYGIVYGSDTEADKEAFAKVDELETAENAFVFRCFEGAPTTDIVIQWEVNR